MSRKGVNQITSVSKKNCLSSFPHIRYCLHGTHTPPVSAVLLAAAFLSPTVQSAFMLLTKLPAEGLWTTNLEGGFVSLCSKTWVFLNSLSQVFTNSAPNTVLQYQRQPGPVTPQPFVSKTSNPALQSRSTPLVPLQNGPGPASKVSHSDNSTKVLQSCWHLECVVTSTGSAG